MKLKNFTHKTAYVFNLVFDDAQVLDVDLMPLIGGYVQPEALKTASLDPDWGCLVFNDGMVDIEPKTLYRFSQQHNLSREMK
jgi:hypothetical protein